MRNQVINYNAADLARDISEESCYKEKVVADILESFESVLMRHFLETDKRTDIAIRPFKGFKLTAVTKKCMAGKNLGKEVSTEDTIVVKASFLRTFKDKLRKNKIS